MNSSKLGTICFVKHFLKRYSRKSVSITGFALVLGTSLRRHLKQEFRYGKSFQLKSRRLSHTKVQDGAAGNLFPDVSGCGDNIQRLNYELESLLCMRNIDMERVFKMISTNADRDLDGKLLQVYFYRLIQEERLTEMSTLLHLLFKESSQFVLCNELWSLYLSKVCELGHHLGATICYHELVDNYKSYYDEITSSYIYSNSRIPFLLSTEVLETLAIIFVQNKDPKRIDGLLEYFKRFFSYSSHSQTYKALKIALVEAYSYEGNTMKALHAFKELCYCFKRHRNFSDGRLSLNTLKASAFNNFRERRECIKNNIISQSASTNFVTDTDKEEKLIVSESQVTLFDPMCQRNVHSLRKKLHVPVIAGLIELNDLPYFREIIYQNVKQLMETPNQDHIFGLLSSIKSCHFMLHLFVTECLCELGYVKEAFLMIVKLPGTYPYILKPILIPDETFICLLRACKRLLLSSYETENSTDRSNGFILLANEIANFYYYNQQTIKKPRLSEVVYEYFITIILLAKKTTYNTIKSQLDRYISGSANHKRLIIYIRRSEYDILEDIIINFASSKYSKYVKPKREKQE
ncbi:uncharacterized protein PRCAT00003348001 [Priceomyces carsonii]|uniref:uncharacterized protein n=1 Tax=Priceomyces carsonii TaxID=28549 RepID=UPI002EDB0B77|nr:unnamed protein product [Priceomyces carsonii]